MPPLISWGGHNVEVKLCYSLRSLHRMYASFAVALIGVVLSSKREPTMLQPLPDVVASTLVLEHQGPIVVRPLLDVPSQDFLVTQRASPTQRG